MSEAWALGNAWDKHWNPIQGPCVGYVYSQQCNMLLDSVLQGKENRKEWKCYSKYIGMPANSFPSCSPTAFPLFPISIMFFFTLFMYDWKRCLQVNLPRSFEDMQVCDACSPLCPCRQHAKSSNLTEYNYWQLGTRFHLQLPKTCKEKNKSHTHKNPIQNTINTNLQSGLWEVIYSPHTHTHASKTAL